MKHLLIVALLVSTPALASEDQCTQQIDMAIVAVKTILPQGAMAGITNEQIEEAKNNITVLETNRSKFTDCDLMPFSQEMLKKLNVK